MSKINVFYSIMAFYALLTYVIFPLGFYYFKRTLQNAGYGFIVGSLVSVALWVTYGSKLV